MVENEPITGQTEVAAIPVELKSDFMAKYGDKLETVDTDNDGGEGGEGDEGGENGGAEDNKGNEGGQGDGGNPKPTTTTTGGDPAGNSAGGTTTELETPLAILAKQYGYDVNDELFKDLDIEDDSIETITEFYNRREKLVQQNTINELFETVPEVKDLVTHLQQGGSVATWKEVKQAEELQLEFAKEDVEGKTKFLMQVYKDKGVSEKAAKRAIEALIDDDELDAEVETYANTLKEQKVKEASAKAAAELAAAKKAEEDSLKVVAQVNNIVKSGKLSNAVIPDTERKSFNEFVLSEKREQAFEALTLEQQLFIDYMVFKGFKVPGLVKTEAPKPEGKRVTIKSKGSSGEGGGSGKEITLEELRKLSGRM